MQKQQEGHDLDTLLLFTYLMEPYRTPLINYFNSLKQHMFYIVYLLPVREVFRWWNQSVMFVQLYPTKHHHVGATFVGWSLPWSPSPLIYVYVTSLVGQTPKLQCMYVRPLAVRQQFCVKLKLYICWSANQKFTTSITHIHTRYIRVAKTSFLMERSKHCEHWQDDVDP